MRMASRGLVAPSLALLASGSSYRGFQRRNDWLLPLVYLHERLVDRIPRGSVDLREFRHSPRTRRPFERECVALQRCRIEIALARPGGDGFGARLLVGAEIEKRARDRHAGFFKEFALGGGEEVFAFIGKALGNRPRAFILLRPEWAARMDKHHFKACGTTTEQQDPGAQFRHRRPRGPRRRVSGIRGPLLFYPGRAVRQASSAGSLGPRGSLRGDPSPRL